MTQDKPTHSDDAGDLGDTVDPAGMLALINTQRRATQSKLVGAYAWLLVAWAAAWAIGFGALWLAEGPGRLPAVASWIVFGACMAAAIAASIITGVRTSSGIRGRSQLQGALYGWSWTISMVGAWLLMGGLQRAGLSRELGTLLYPALFVMLVGVLYLAGGALWRSPMQYALGVAMIVVVAVATVVGAPLHYLIYATAGPVAMLIVAVLMLRGVLPHELGSAAEPGQDR